MTNNRWGLTILCRYQIKRIHKLSNDGNGWQQHTFPQGARVVVKEVTLSKNCPSLGATLSMQEQLQCSYCLSNFKTKRKDSQSINQSNLPITTILQAAK